MRYLVTGVAGFVGSSIADRLLAEGQEVVGIDCFVPYYPRAIKEKNIESLKDSKNFTFFEFDIANLGSDKDTNLPFRREEFAEFDVIFHQAAQAGVRASWGSYFSSYSANNIMASQIILEALRVAKANTRVVYASSSSVYGNAEKFPTAETVLPAPVSPYGVTKLAAEHLMRLYSDQFGIHTTSLRYFTVYGPRQRPDMAFHRFCYAALTGNQINIFGDGEQSRDFTYISDIVEANILAAAKGTLGSVYNLGGGEITTVNSALKTLRNLIDKPLNVNYMAKEAGDARHTSADCTLAKRELGFNPIVSVEKGLKLELEWVEENLKLLSN